MHDLLQSDGLSLVRRIYDPGPHPHEWMSHAVCLTASWWSTDSCVTPSCLYGYWLAVVVSVVSDHNGIRNPVTEQQEGGPHSVSKKGFLLCVCCHNKDIVMADEPRSCLRNTDSIYILPMKKLRSRAVKEPAWGHRAEMGSLLHPWPCLMQRLCSVVFHEKIHYSVTSAPGSCCTVECLYLVPGGKCQGHHHLGQWFSTSLML